MRQMTEQRRIFKLPSKFIKSNQWDVNLPLDEALRDYPDYVVTLADSQIMRWLDEINGIDDSTSEIRKIKDEIQKLKRKPINTKTKNKIKSLYAEINSLQFQKDYICVVMANLSDYDRANKGFTVNGVRFKRLLGTNGGIKNSTIVYVSERVYDEISRRIANGRNINMEFIPAKLEAYQSLVCSGSTPIPQPDGVIVVDDCITHFKEDVVVIHNENDGEPITEYKDQYEIERNNSDGFGLMLPRYAQKVNQYLCEDSSPITGMNTRYSFEKGMLYTFSFDDFATEIKGGYKLRDVWGEWRDIRDAEVILTASMLKLWDSYDSWESYYQNCQKNNYQFATPKICPNELENVRTSNYQFLQSYTDLTDHEIDELIAPTINEIKDVLGGDYRKTLVYLMGNITDPSKMKDDFVKSLTINPDMINDPYVQQEIYRTINKQIDRAKRGKIKLNGNYAMISGDPYALCESMFNIEVKGLLDKGEVYHKYWIDRGADEIALFRAPMTSSANIKKCKLRSDDLTNKWFKYMNTALILNAWDTTADALNGADFDGDTSFTTNNPILLKHTQNEKTIICIQQKAEKKIPTEADLIAANKIAFNDKIGAITNRVTAMFERQAQFSPDSEEYKVLQYRIMCGQHYQQCQIDAAKGIISKPMPASWYAVDRTKDYTDSERSIIADLKPYFMIYVYPDLKTKYKNYIKNCNANSVMRFGLTLDQIKESENKEHADFYDQVIENMPLGIAECVVNKIAWKIEQSFNKVYSPAKQDFDYRILKSNAEYSATKFNQILAIYKRFTERASNFERNRKITRMSTDEAQAATLAFFNDFKAECEIIVPDEKELTNIVLDICYLNSNKSKKFAWEMCGTQIIKNLLANSHAYHIPIKSENGEFNFNGFSYSMMTIEEGVNANDDIK